MKMYILLNHVYFEEYEERSYIVVGVFSTKEKAESIKKEYEKKDENLTNDEDGDEIVSWYEIVEIKVDSIEDINIT